MAALTVPDTGNAATVSGLGITTNVVSIDAMTISQTPVDITTLATTGFEKVRPGSLRKPVEVTWKYMWLGAAPGITTDMIPTAEAYAGTTFTVTFPGAGSIAGTAFVKEVKTPSLTNGEAMMGSCTIVYDGVTGPTFTVA